MIQGPLFISGGLCPNVPPIGYPIMLPTENNPPSFQIPPNVVIDTSNALVDESKVREGIV
jgi:hypothetical protein